MPSRIRDAFGDFRRTWPQLLIANLLSVAFTIVVATPLLGLLLKLFLMTTDEGVLTDAEIASFLLHPLGLLALVVLGALWLAVYLALQGVLMVVGFGAVEERRVSYLDALVYVARRGRGFAELAGRVIGTVLLVVAPFLAAVGGVYLAFLGEHDINYYLATRPPELLRALAVAGAVVGGLAIVLARLAAGWVVALPVLLFEAASGKAALRRSREVTAPRRWSIAGVLAAWFAAASLVSTAASFLVGRVGSLLVPDLHGNPAVVIGGLAVVLTLATVTSLGIRFVTDSVLPLVVVRWYRSLAGPGELAPAIASPGTLGEGRGFRVPGKALLAGSALAVAVVAGGAYLAARAGDREEPALVIAHRGASAGAPENTRAAFELAFEQGADWIELDVQETAEGEVIVAHDSDFMKQARSPLKVWEATADDLAELDIGSWFDPRFADQRPPRLREVLEWARGRIRVVIELKYYGHDERLEERVVELVEATSMQDDVMIMSLKRPGLRKLAALRPEWTRGLLNTASLGDLTNVDVDFLALNGAAATRSQIRRAHRRGMQVYVWTVNDPVQMSVMLSRGVDGLITDVPGDAREVLELREALSPLGHFVVWMAAETGLLHEGEAVSSSAADA